MATIFVNADWSAVVPEGSPDAAFGVQPRDAKRLGIDRLPVRDGAEIPDDLPEPDTLESHVLRTASLLAAPVDEPEAVGGTDEPESKEASQPDDKQAPKPADKSVSKPRTK